MAYLTESQYKAIQASTYEVEIIEEETPQWHDTFRMIAIAKVNGVENERFVRLVHPSMKDAEFVRAYLNGQARNYISHIQGWN